MRNLIRETNAGTKGWVWVAATGTDTAKIEEIDYQGALGVKLTRLAGPGSWNYVQKGSVLLNGLKSATDYILSMDIKQSNPNAFKVSIRQGDSLNPWTTTVTVPKVGTTDWVHMDLPMRTLDEFPESNGQVLYMQDFITVPDTEVCIANLALYEGTVPQPWTPAPEDVLLSSIPESILEPGSISTGNTVIAGQTLENMKSSDSSWLTIRVRTKNIIPLMGNTAFYVNFPTNLQCFPIYFDSSDLSIAAPCDAHTTKDVFIAPQGAVGVELVFKKSDNSEITPADVTNVTGGGIDMATLARASVQLEDFSGELKDLEDKTILNATALEQRLSSQILQTQEQIQQSVSEQYFTKDETNTLISQVSTAFTQTAEGWQMDFNKIVSIVNANQAATDSEFQEWSKYIRFVDGNIILGAVANPVVLTIKNDRISFAQSGQEVAYLSNAELVITDARVTHSLIIGKFGLVPRANGSMDLKKVL